MDFITDLPGLENNIVVWVVLDRFLKMAYFIPLSGLLSARALVPLFIWEIF